MQKVVLISVVVLLMTGCSVAKRSTIAHVGKPVINELTVGSVYDNNLTNNDFSVTKAEVIYNDGEARAEVTAIIKYQRDGNFLISLRTKAGIEIARIFISKDTILANDRINKKLYYGSAQDLENKYGISTSALPLVMGDLINENIEIGKEINCIDGEGFLKERLNGKEVTYTLDCNYNKTKNAEIQGIGGELSINIEYRDFRNYQGITYPSNVIIRDNKEKSEIVIYLRKMDFNKVENLKFIPGEGYEKKLLR